MGCPVSLNPKLDAQTTRLIASSFPGTPRASELPLENAVKRGINSAGSMIGPKKGDLLDDRALISDETDALCP